VNTAYVKSRIVTVFGGSGFVGGHVVRALVRRGYRVRIAVRRPELANYLQPLGHVGQIVAVQANVRAPWSVERAVEGADAVVNLVGILANRGRQTFEAVQAGGPRTIAAACRAAGIANLVHVSAIGADPESDSEYARSKARGEEAIRTALPGAIVFRPSIQFGPEDHFFNRFAGMARISPFLPLVGAGTRFQPVFVGDVAEAVARAIAGEAARGTIYELGGPEVKTFRELMEIMLREIDRRRILLPIPFPIARLMGGVLQLLPGKLLTVDQVRQLKRDNVVSAAAQAERRTLGGLGIVASGVEAILPSYLVRFRPRGQFERRSA
jgi:NADH dehydrogenase